MIKSNNVFHEWIVCGSENTSKYIFGLVITELSLLQAIHPGEKLHWKFPLLHLYVFHRTFQFTAFTHFLILMHTQARCWVQ